MVLRALLAKLQLLVGAVDLCPFVLAVHTEEVVLSELFLVSKSESHLVLDPVARGVIDHEVILEGVLLGFGLKQD